MLDLILPVRNRFNTFKFTLNSCINFIKSDERISGSRIIIIDNNSTDIPKDYFKKFPDFVNYIKFPKLLPMNENWERALALVQNKYFTFIGSDDGIIFNKNMINRIIEHKSSKCFFWQKICYFWPSSIEKDSKAKFSIPLPFYSEGEIESEEIIKNILKKKLPWNFLPTVYNSFCSKEIISNFYQKYPSINFFWNSVPDICSGQNILLNFDNVYYLEEPLGISGVSKYSQGLSVRSGNPNNDSKEFKIFHDQKMVNSSSLMGVDDFSDTPLAMTAELYLKGIKIMNLPKNNYLEELAHNCIKNERKAKKNEKAYEKDFLGKRNRICRILINSEEDLDNIEKISIKLTKLFERSKMTLGKTKKEIIGKKSKKLSINYSMMKYLFLIKNLFTAKLMNK